MYVYVYICISSSSIPPCPKTGTLTADTSSCSERGCLASDTVDVGEPFGLLGPCEANVAIGNPRASYIPSGYLT